MSIACYWVGNEEKGRGKNKKLQIQAEWQNVHEVLRHKV